MVGWENVNQSAATTTQIRLDLACIDNGEARWLPTTARGLHATQFSNDKILFSSTEKRWDSGQILESKDFSALDLAPGQS